MARILIIDDEGPIRSVLRQMLAHYGHTVIEARNGSDGLKLFDHDGADIVITDLAMPEKSGFEVLMELGKRHPPVKIIAMTGGGKETVDSLEAADLLGAAKVLAKPFSNADLIAAVNELLSHPESLTRSSE